MEREDDTRERSNFIDVLTGGPAHGKSEYHVRRGSSLMVVKTILIVATRQSASRSMGNRAEKMTLTECRVGCPYIKATAFDEDMSSILSKSDIHRNRKGLSNDQIGQGITVGNLSTDTTCSTVKYMLPGIMSLSAS